MTSTCVLVTGANGFVGRATVAALKGDERLRVIECVRGASVPGARYFDLETPSVMPVLDDVDVIIHTAARVHVMKERSADCLGEFRRANVDATLALARHAAAVGVKRFIYISSIKVNGESTAEGQAFYADDVPAPRGAYAVSKHEAEAGLMAEAEAVGMEIVIIRPPLVYGPGVRANFLSMMKWVRRGVPLPLGSINNSRSLVYLGNLTDLIHVCTLHQAAANQIFLVGDPVPVSTSTLLQMLAEACGVASRLVPVPAAVLMAIGTLLGKREALIRILGSLQVDLKKNRELLGWVPPIQTADGLKVTASFFKDQTNR